MSDNSTIGNSFQNSLNSFISSLQLPLDALVFSTKLPEPNQSALRDVIENLCKLAYAKGSSDATTACLQDINLTIRTGK